MRAKNRVTLQAIADEVGLSKYAVSRSLAGKSGVSEETRQLILGAAERLGYTKQAGRHDTLELGLVFHDVDLVNSELNQEVQAGAQREAERLGVNLRVRWAHGDDILAQHAKSFSGLILAGPHSRDAIARAEAVGRPIIRMGWTEPLEQVDYVGGTDHEGGQAVVKFLLGLGHKTIAYVYGSTVYRGRNERYYGAREVIEQAGDAELHLMKFDETLGFAGALGKLESNGIYPTAYFCAHDGLALTVVSELLGRGYRIPDDVSVVGFGDYSAATQISPPLTTVRVFGREAGAAALALLLERIDRPRNQDQPPRSIRIVSRLIERKSTAQAKLLHT